MNLRSFFAALACYTIAHLCALPASAVPMASDYGDTPSVLQYPYYSFHNLYEDGGLVADVYRDRADGYRRLSIKMYTLKDTDGTLSNRVGIVDITSQNRTFAPVFVPLNIPGMMTVRVYGALDNGGSLARDYELFADPGGAITLQRPDTPPGQGGVSIFPLTQLMILRADEAARQGVMVNIDGTVYYVLGQGGASGSYLFFDKTLIDNRAYAANPFYLRPLAVAVGVENVDADGLTVQGTGKPDLGTLPNAATGAQDPFHLELNPATGTWLVVPGKGDAP